MSPILPGTLANAVTHWCKSGMCVVETLFWILTFSGGVVLLDVGSSLLAHSHQGQHPALRCAVLLSCVLVGSGPISAAPASNTDHFTLGLPAWLEI